MSAKQLLASISAVACVTILCVTPVHGQCDAPSTWFPHPSHGEPDFSAPTDNCGFHQWGWDAFLWLTRSTGEGRIVLMDLPLARDLFMPGKRPGMLDNSMRMRMSQRPLLLVPRSAKSSGTTEFGEINQAGSRGILVDQTGRAVYYASHVSTTYYEFVRKNKLYLKSEYVKSGKANPGLNFPVKSVELKSAWRIVPAGAKADNFFTTTALIHPLACKDGGTTCTGDNVIVDQTRTIQVTVALVGLHVVGVVEDHPEFIWATFEHIGNAPDLGKLDPTSSDPVSSMGFTFYAARTPANQCNQVNSGTVKLDVATQRLSPITNVFHDFAFGGGSATDTGNIKSLNGSVHKQLAAKSVWKNYRLVGGVWFEDGDDFQPGLTGNSIQKFVRGSMKVSNSTMETYTQAKSGVIKKPNCFACHATAASDGLPPMNLNVSHILKNGLIQRETTALIVTNYAKIDATLDSYADVQKLFETFVKTNNIPIQFAPHSDFWNTMTHDQFVNGNVPGVSDPATGNPLPMMVKGDSANSNIILALQGKGPLFDPSTGSIGRMPPSGPFMSAGDIQLLADWIDNGAPK